MVMSDEAVYELINRRRRQVLVHSIIYYKMNENIVPDNVWASWAVELEELQQRYPEIAAKAPYAEGFEDFDHSSGYDLPLNDPLAVSVARYILRLHKQRIAEGK